MTRRENKKHVLPFRQTDRVTFNQIKRGIKKVETRGAGPKYASIRSGDILIMACGKSRFEKKIKKLSKFKTLKGLFRKYPLKRIFPDIKTIREAEKIFHSYPGYKERLKKFGILAFEL